MNHIVLILEDHFEEESLIKLLGRQFPGARVTSYSEAGEFILDWHHGKLSDASLVIFGDRLPLFYASEKGEKLNELFALYPSLVNSWDPTMTDTQILPLIRGTHSNILVIILTNFDDRPPVSGALLLERDIHGYKFPEILSAWSYAS